MSCQKIQQDKTAGEELQVGHNSDQIKDIVSFTVILWLKNIIFLLLIFGYTFQITHFGAVYKKKLPKILIILYPCHKQNQREATYNGKNNLDKKNNLKANNILR